MTQTLGAQAARGAAVTLAAQIARIGIQVVAVAVMSRLVSPADTGLVAMVAAIIGIAELLRDFGLSSAAIQSPTLSREQRDNLFWINTAIGALLAGTGIACAGLVAGFFDEPRLVGITHVMSCAFLLNAMATQYRAGLTRAMRFRALAVIDVLAPAVGLVVAITLGILGLGYWAIVWQQLTTAVVGLVANVTLARWLPRRPRRGVPMRSFMKFGTSLLISQLLGYLANNLDTIMLGRRYGPYETGFYTKAFQTLMTPLGQIRAPSTSVALPALSRVRGDQERFNSFVITGQVALALPVTIVLAVVVGAAEPLVGVFMGPNWTPSIPVMRLLAVAGLFQTLAFVGYWIYLARALTRSLMNFSLFSAVLRIVCIVIGANWGIVGVAAGYAIAPAITSPISLFWLSKVTDVPHRTLQISAMRLIALGSVASAAVYGTTVATSTWPYLIQLVLATITSVAVAALAAAVFPPVRRDVGHILFVARLALSNRSRRGAHAAPRGADK